MANPLITIATIANVDDHKYTYRVFAYFLLLHYNCYQTTFDTKCSKFIAFRAYIPILEELPNWAKNCEMNFKIRVVNTLFVTRI